MEIVAQVIWKVLDKQIRGWHIGAVQSLTAASLGYCLVSPLSMRTRFRSRNIRSRPLKMRQGSLLHCQPTFLAISIRPVGLLSPATRNNNTRLVLVGGHIERRVRGEEVCWPDGEMVDLDGPVDERVSQRMVSFMILGKESDGSQTKGKRTGPKQKTTYITGQSSTLGLCVNPNTLQTTGLLFLPSPPPPPSPFASRSSPNQSPR